MSTEQIRLDAIAEEERTRCPLCRGGCIHAGDLCTFCRGIGRHPKHFGRFLDAVEQKVRDVNRLTNIRSEMGVCIVQFAREYVLARESGNLEYATLCYDSLREAVTVEDPDLRFPDQDSSAGDRSA